MSYTVDEILTALNKYEVRATYGAVAALLGIHQKNVGQALGNRRSYASWVVSKSTGMPSGYMKANLHKNLQASRTIIETPDELVALRDKASRES